jgi:hypothetical protein
MWYGRHTDGVDETPWSGAAATSWYKTSAKESYTGMRLPLGYRQLPCLSHSASAVLDTYWIAGFNGRDHGWQVVCPGSGVSLFGPSTMTPRRPLESGPGQAWLTQDWGRGTGADNLQNRGRAEASD